MVNEKKRGAPDAKLSVKSRLLSVLREEPAACFSGETLAEKLLVSRVAVWKAVNVLREAGYPITKSAKGYSWKEPDSAPSVKSDFLYPWEFGERESSFYHLPTTDSTMNRAAELAAKGCSAGTVISAGEQTAGRGRNGHRWASGFGGLFFTLLERPSVNAAEYFRISLAFQIAVAKALGRFCVEPVRLRWPNDLYVGEKKIAGALTEFHAEGDTLAWISLGIGVNVNNAPHSRGSTNCSAAAGHPLSRQEVLLAILGEWDSAKKNVGSPKLHREWNSLAWGAGKNAAALENRAAGKETGGTNRSKEALAARGTFMGIDELGRGILKGEDGRRRLFNPGIISFRFGGY